MPIEKQSAPTTIDRIRRAADQLAAARGAYREMLAFFGELFVLQENAVETCRVAPPRMEKRLLEIKQGSRLPLLDRRDFPLDPAAADETLTAIGRLAHKTGAGLAAAMDVLCAHRRPIESGLARWCHWVLTDDTAALAAAADGLEIDAHQMTVAVYHSLLPAVLHTSRGLAAAHLPNDLPRPAGGCPVCGGAATFSCLGTDGQRDLVCGFCRHQWPVARMRCPYCNDNATEGLPYFFSPEENEYRVYTCPSCRRYFKTVDRRETIRPFYAPLEQVVTLHLDIRAQEMGYAVGPGFSFLS